MVMTEDSELPKTLRAGLGPLPNVLLPKMALSG